VIKLKEKMKRISVIAHRGYSIRYPENTWIAFKEAVAAGAPMIELDTSLTKNRVPVVIHDDTLDRTTQGKGKVAGHEWKSIRSLDAGSWFNPSYQDEKIPHLLEVLSFFHDKCLINIEIKGEAYDVREKKDSIENQILNYIEENGMSDSIIISSFNFPLLERIRMKHKTLALAVLYKKKPDRDVIQFCLNIKALSLNLKHRVISEKVVNQVKKEGLSLLAYTVNNPARYQALLRMGVDAVFSDDYAGLSQVSVHPC